MKTFVSLLAILLISIGMNCVFAQQTGQEVNGTYTIKDDLKRMGLLDTLPLQKVHGKYFFYGFESGRLLFYWGRNSKEKITTTLPRKMFGITVDKKFKKPVIVYNFHDSNFLKNHANKDEDLSKRDPNELLMNDGLIGVPVYKVTVFMSPKTFNREKILWDRK